MGEWLRSGDNPAGLSEASHRHLAGKVCAIPALALDRWGGICGTIPLNAQTWLVGQPQARFKGHNQERVTSSARRAPLWRSDFLWPAR
jgi:hypothetical protein